MPGSGRYPAVHLEDHLKHAGDHQQTNQKDNQDCPKQYLHHFLRPFYMQVGKSVGNLTQLCLFPILTCLFVNQRTTYACN